MKTEFERANDEGRPADRRSLRELVLFEDQSDHGALIARALELGLDGARVVRVDSKRDPADLETRALACDGAIVATDTDARLAGLFCSALARSSRRPALVVLEGPGSRWSPGDLERLPADCSVLDKRSGEGFLRRVVACLLSRGAGETSCAEAKSRSPLPEPAGPGSTRRAPAGETSTGEATAVDPPKGDATSAAARGSADRLAARSPREAPSRSARRIAGKAPVGRDADDGPSHEAVGRAVEELASTSRALSAIVARFERRGAAPDEADLSALSYGVRSLADTTGRLARLAGAPLARRAAATALSASVMLRAATWRRRHAPVEVAVEARDDTPLAAIAPGPVVSWLDRAVAAILAAAPTRARILVRAEPFDDPLVGHGTTCASVTIALDRTRAAAAPTSSRLGAGDRGWIEEGEWLAAGSGGRLVVDRDSLLVRGARLVVPAAASMRDEIDLLHVASAEGGPLDSNALPKGATRPRVVSVASREALELVGAGCRYDVAILELEDPSEAAAVVESLAAADPGCAVVIPVARSAAQDDVDALLAHGALAVHGTRDAGPSRFELVVAASELIGSLSSQ